MADQVCGCGSTEFEEADDGFRYCLRCGIQADGFVETGNADEDFMPLGGGGDATAAIYSAAHSRYRRAELFPSSAIKSEPISHSQFWTALTLHDDEDLATPVNVKTERYDDDGVGPTAPEDFGWIGSNAPRFEDYHNEVRIKYVMGLQLMVEFQCEALVKNFNVSPLICGLAGTLWLRFVAATKVFDDGWVDKAINESESQHQGDLPAAFQPRNKHIEEPHNMYGQRAVMIWLRSLKKQIPLPYTLAISFLACHLAREAVLTKDIEKWSVEGKLPYFSAFVEVEKSIGGPSRACPISSSLMFRPHESVTAQKLELLSARIAKLIKLTLPSVNFYAIASRYLRKLQLPLDSILPHAIRIYEWSMPPELWLSSNERRLPTRIGVMSILIVAIRLRYNIHGFGNWEKSICSRHTSTSESKETNESETKLDTDMKENCPTQKPELDTAKLLCDLEARYDEILENYEYSDDLPTYLQYCKDVVFAGLEPSYENREERKLIDELWEIYQNEKDSKTAVQEEIKSTAEKEEKKRNDERYFNIPSSINRSRGADLFEDGSQSQDDEASEQNDLDEETKIIKDEAIRKLKIDMDENRFNYIPPRVNPKRFDYLHYIRKRSGGLLNYVAHGDYYILLRACAKVAQIEIRLMHIGVLGFERRLAWLEHRINRSLHLRVPSFFCQFCSEIDSVNTLSDQNNI